eukprot:gb/GECG01004647.1/.p1 GENE.gb/GECG01004647.1/~~gb/GECG01004647.1/.p1  ORF type:complete len:360 (+),score=17.41 gb/GECG01004647.1/:1-1080(+)
MEVEWRRYVSYSHRFGVVIALGLVLRVLVALHGHSGEGKPPMHGDFEAQRHWMEITVNLPPSEWYHDSPSNNLEYWGLDYPPLSAYHSWLFGKIAQRIYPPLVELFKSRGIETSEAKLFMRLSVLFSELIFVLALWITYRCLLPAAEATTSSSSLWIDTETQADLALAVVAAQFLNPALLLIDHGHFQYNHVALAFCQLSLIFLAKALATTTGASGKQRNTDMSIFTWLASGAMAYAIALCFKQMSLYIAPALAMGLGLLVFDSGHVSAGWVSKTVGVTLVSGGTILFLSFAPLLRWDALGLGMRQGTPAVDRTVEAVSRYYRSVLSRSLSQYFTDCFLCHGEYLKIRLRPCGVHWIPS